MKILLANFTKMVGDSGGLAKVTCAFANEMVKRGHQVSLIYNDEKKGNFFFPINESVKLYNLRERSDGKIIKYPLHYKIAREIARAVWRKGSRAVNGIFNKRYLLDNVIKFVKKDKPDIIVSFQSHASRMLLCDWKTDIPVITMSHGDPEEYFQLCPKEDTDSFLKSAVCQVLLPVYEKHIKSYMPECRIVTIGNAIPQYGYHADLLTDKSKYKIIFVGRFTKGGKRPHIIVEAFAKLADKYPDWNVELWGMPERKAYMIELERLITSFNLKDRVNIMGTTDKIPEKLSNADIFAFPSAFEGFPLALGEAMSMGLPAVGFRSTPAVEALIDDGRTGLLCNDGVDAFAEALDTLMGNKKMRVSMGKYAKEDMKNYAPENIWNQWEELLGAYRRR